jgi:hypothetical protein
MTNAAAALLGGHQIIESPSPVLNYQRSSRMRCYWIMPVFNPPVTIYRYGDIRR